jgi:hypothetical protein
MKFPVMALVGAAMLAGACLAQSSQEATDRAAREGTRAVKWHPGWYLKTQGNHAATDQKSYNAGLDDYISDQMIDSDVIRGAVLWYAWGAIEKDAGEYDWSAVDSHVAAVAEADKYAILVFSFKGFRNDVGGLAPANLAGDVHALNSGRGGIVAVWEPAVMDQAIAFVEAAAARYDTHPNVEMVLFGDEWAHSLGRKEPYGPPAKFNADYYRELSRMVAAGTAAFDRTMFGVPVNAALNGWGDDLIAEAYETGRAAKAGPDIHDDFGARLFRGGSAAAKDYRCRMANYGTLTAPNLGGSKDILPLTNAFSRYIVPNCFSHVGVVSTSQSPGADWHDDILPFIEANAISVEYPY